MTPQSGNVLWQENNQRWWGGVMKRSSWFHPEVDYFSRTSHHITLFYFSSTTAYVQVPVNELLVTETRMRFSFILCLSDHQARQHRKFAVAEGDHLTMLNVYEAFVKVTKSQVLNKTYESTRFIWVMTLILSTHPSVAPEEFSVVSGALPEL